MHKPSKCIHQLGPVLGLMGLLHNPLNAYAIKFPYDLNRPLNAYITCHVIILARIMAIPTKIKIRTFKSNLYLKLHTFYLSHFTLLFFNDFSVLKISLFSFSIFLRFTLDLSLLSCQL